MPSRNVALIGFQDQGNLGLGYLASVLRKQNFAPAIFDFRQAPETLAHRLRELQPLIVGFSVIFQYYLPQFAWLAWYLRHSGITCHFTCGGHFPTLEPAEVFRAVPEMDTVVRGEGEITLRDLAEHLYSDNSWTRIPGIAFREGEQVVLNPARSLVADLDALPFPEAPARFPSVFGLGIAPILASRGCARSCSFCSIHPFYGSSPGKHVRIRRPASVVDEMHWLYTRHGVRIFLFQDDDFPVWGKFGEGWVSDFLETIRERDLYGKTLWKISCRADQVAPNLFRRMREHGLHSVYLGIESGNDSGLRVLGKQTSVEQNRRAVSTLRELDLAHPYGFMMFDPSSTFASLRSNLRFLRWVVDDDVTGATICRMVPYAGTPIRESLAQQGRLRGSIEDPDYDFLDPNLNVFFDSVRPLISGWLYGVDAVFNQVNWAWEEFVVLKRLFPPLTGAQDYSSRLRAITRQSNQYLLGSFEEALHTFQAGGAAFLDEETIHRASEELKRSLLASRNEFVAVNAETIVSAEQASGPSPAR